MNRIDYRSIYVLVCENIAQHAFYETRTIEAIQKSLLNFTPRQIVRALVHAKRKGWINYADAGVVYLRVRGRALFPNLDPQPLEEYDPPPIETGVNVHGRVVFKGIAASRGQDEIKRDSTSRKRKEAHHDEIRRKLRLRKKAPPSKSKTPAGERNPSKRLIPEDWG